MANDEQHVSHQSTDANGQTETGNLGFSGPTSKSLLKYMLQFFKRLRREAL